MAWVYLDDKFPRHPKVMAAMTLQPLLRLDAALAAYREAEEG